MSAASPAQQNWLFGPARDLLLGCGAGHALIFLLLLFPIVENGIGPWILFGASVLALVTNAPHYGATLIRVYEYPEERRKFSLFAVHTTIAVSLLFVGGLYNTLLGSALFSVYTTWSPWHFAGQNYGLALMFLRRRNVVVSPTLKRLFYASFLLSMGLSVLMLHRGPGNISTVPVPNVVGDYRFLSLGLPPAFTDIAFPIVAIAYLGVVGAAVILLLRQTTARVLVPTAFLIGIQAVWFSIPAVLHFTGNFNANNLALSGFVISAAHSIQYLWVTAYYASRSDRPVSAPVFYGKTLLAGAAVFALPALLLAPAALGAVSYAAGLSTVLFSCVNIHHFILDGAIWKLRDGRVAQILLKASSRSTPHPAAIGTHPQRGRSWMRPALVALGAAFLAIECFNVWEREFGIRRALFAEQIDRVSVAAQRLKWIGREDYGVYRDLADKIAIREARTATQRGRTAADGNFDAALANYHRSIETYPTPKAWLGIGNIHRLQGKTDAALEAYRRALAVDPKNPRAHNRIGELWLAEGNLERARWSLHQALAAAPRDERIQTAIKNLLQAERAAAATRGRSAAD